MRQWINTGRCEHARGRGGRRVDILELERGMSAKLAYKPRSAVAIALAIDEPEALVWSLLYRMREQGSVRRRLRAGEWCYELNR